MKTTTTEPIVVVNAGLRIPRSTLQKLDKHKGYYSRNRYMQMIVEGYLSKLEMMTGETKSEDK